MDGIASTIGFSSCLDSTESVVYQATGGAFKSGSGLTNNRPFGTTSGFQALTQNAGKYNKAVNERISRSKDAKSTQGLVSVVTDAELRSDFAPTFRVSGNYMIWYDTAIIRLKDLFDSMASFGLVKRFDAQLRLYVNTGSLTVGVNTPNNAACGYETFTQANSTFSNTVPITINLLAGSVTAGGIPATVTHVTAGVFLRRPAVTTFNSINLASSGADHAMPSCRIYYSSVAIQPQKELAYIEQNSSKTCVFKNTLYNLYSNILAGNTFTQLIQAGVSNPHSLIIIPFINSATYTQYGSPYDTAPGSFSPCRLSNLQVTVGGVQVMQSAFNYGFKNYQQFQNSESLTSSDLGISNGIVSRKWWEQNRIYYVNLSRGRPADKVTPRSITVSCTNSSAVPVDLMIFCTYLDEVTLDVSRGIITK